MNRVLATGTFDILHPGHLHYLQESRALGDTLYVIVSRREMIDHKASPIVPDEQRREMVASLKPVDQAVLGSTESIFEPLYEIDPDIITLGHDQHQSEEGLKAKLSKKGFDVDVVRIDAKEPDTKLYSSSKIINKIRSPMIESHLGWSNLDRRTAD